MYGLHIIDVTVIVIYLIGITIAGLWASRKARGLGGFFMGNRSFGKFFMLMHAFGTGTHTDQAVSVKPPVVWTLSWVYSGGLPGGR